MDKQTWEQRYGQNEYIYGQEPNEFFATELRKLRKGKILLPCEGEGRNAVFAAKLGWQVDAFDYAENGKQKTLDLTEQAGVQINNYWINGAKDFKPEEENYDAIALIYCHIEPESRYDFHQKMVKALKPGGTLIFEAFSKEQINYNSGGPPVEERLFNANEIKQEFKGLNFQILNKSIIQLNEGSYHQGEASVIRFIGQKATTSN